MPESSKRNLKLQSIRIIGTTIILMSIAFYIYFLRTGQAEQYLSSIRSYGIFGVLLCILILTFLNIIPVPAEPFSLFLMEVYGVWQGFIYSMIAGVGGSVLALIFSKHLARPIIKKLTGKYLKKADDWIKKRETLGLLSIRFIPLVPYHAVNYICGILNVRILPFIWTTFLGILPYNLAFAGMYAGLRKGSTTWGILGGGIFVLLLLIGFLVRKKSTQWKE